MISEENLTKLRQNKNLTIEISEYLIKLINLIINY